MDGLKTARYIVPSLLLAWLLSLPVSADTTSGVENGVSFDVNVERATLQPEMKTIKTYEVVRTYSWSDSNSYNDFSWGDSNAYSSGTHRIGVFDEDDSRLETYRNQGHQYSVNEYSSRTVPTGKSHLVLAPAAGEKANSALDNCILRQTTQVRSLLHQKGHTLESKGIHHVDVVLIEANAKDLAADQNGVNTAFHQQTNSNTTLLGGTFTDVCHAAESAALFAQIPAPATKPKASAPVGSAPKEKTSHPVGSPN